MKLTVFGSSSAGNAYALEFDDGQILLLEAGMSYANVYRTFPDRWKDIIGCLITHEHGDHAKFAKEYDDNGISIHASNGTMEVIGKQLKHSNAFITSTVHKIGLEKSFYSFNVQHNAADPVGYIIMDHTTKESLLFVTDTAYFKPYFTGLNYMMVECNHVHIDPKHPWAKHHLNLDRCMKFLGACDLKRTRKIILIHLSDSNSNEELMVGSVQQLTRIDTVVANRDMVIELRKDPF